MFYFFPMAKGKKSRAPKPAEPPLVVTKSNAQTWNDEADVVIVGFGGAGACAALEARAHGASVIVLDRFHGGGATAISGGVFYAGGGTHIQQEAGVDDDPDEMFRYLSLEVKGVVSEETLRDFCDKSVENLDWLERYGVPFEGSLCPYKTSYPTDDYYLYYSGNEGFAPYKNAAKPAPRGHRAKGTGLPGANFYEPLRRAALEAGARVEYEARVTRLVIDGQNQVLGVEYRQIEPGFWSTLHRKLHEAGIAVVKYNPRVAARLRERCFRIAADHSVTKRIRARNGVILAAGGFIYNRQMVKEIAPQYRTGMPLGTVGDNGSGILLGQSVGAKTDLMSRISAWRFINPPEAFAHGMIINRRGERYINEFMYGAAVGEAMVEHNDGVALLIIDADLKKLAREQCKPGKAQWFQRAPALLNLWFNSKEAKSLEELAKITKAPLDTLRKTFEEYNDAAEGKIPDRFGKDPAKMHAMRKGPYFVIDAGIRSKRFPCPTLTLGGLVVDERTGQVRRGDGGVIPGLYAAGRNAVGVCSRQYVSGLSIADCVYSGRRAGGAAARGEVYADKDAPSHGQGAPIQAKPLEGIPMIRERQVADPSPEAHPTTATRRGRNGGSYPRQPLQRPIRRPGGAGRVSPKGRLGASKRSR
ncbi:MAG: FAD-binding protein [Myxococcales bacterium]|jgi:3-oxo-5alpha-steroid 4-dehydrogenase